MILIKVTIGVKLLNVKQLKVRLCPTQRHSRRRPSLYPAPLGAMLQIQDILNFTTGFRCADAEPHSAHHELG